MILYSSLANLYKFSIIINSYHFVDIVVKKNLYYFLLREYFCSVVYMLKVAFLFLRKEKTKRWKKEREVCIWKGVEGLPHQHVDADVLWDLKFLAGEGCPILVRGAALNLLTHCVPQNWRIFGHLGQTKFRCTDTLHVVCQLRLSHSMLLWLADCTWHPFWCVSFRRWCSSRPF